MLNNIRLQFCLRSYTRKCFEITGTIQIVGLRELFATIDKGLMSLEKSCFFVAHAAPVYDFSETIPGV